MLDPDRIESEARAIQMVLPYEGTKVILSELEKRINNAYADVPISDPAWERKMASQIGAGRALSEFRDWIHGRSKFRSPNSPQPPTEA